MYQLHIAITHSGFRLWPGSHEERKQHRLKTSVTVQASPGDVLILKGGTAYQALEVGQDKPAAMSAEARFFPR